MVLLSFFASNHEVVTCRIQLFHAVSFAFENTVIMLSVSILSIIFPKSNFFYFYVMISCYIMHG
jgi:hypothetical protein